MNEEMNEEVSEDVLSIDQNRLDEEWVNQPKMFAHYALKLADAKKGADEAKANRDVIKAELTKRAYMSPESFKLDKATDGRVNAAVTSHPKLIEATQVMVEAKYASDVYSAMVSALDQRKKALEGLVQLFGQNYFAPPQASEENMGAMRKEKRSATDKRVAKNLRKKGAKK